MSKGKGEAPARWQEGRICVQNQILFQPEMLRGLKQTLCTPGHRDPTETETELCLSVSCGGMGWQCSVAGTGLWVQQTWVWHKPSWRRSPLTPPQSCQNLHRTGKQTLRGHNRTLCTRTQEKRAMTPQETVQTCLWVSGSLWWRRGLMVACCRVGGTKCSTTCLGSFKGGHHYLHYHHHSLAPGKQQGGNTARPINRKLD